VLRKRSSQRVGGTPEKWLHSWEFGRTTTAEDITFPGTVTGDEVSDIADEATITLINSSPTPPATPAAPVGQFLKRTSRQLTDAGKWQHSFEYGNTTALQHLQFPTDLEQTDPSALKDEDHQSGTTATSTPPATPAPRIAGLVLREISSVRIAGTPEKWLHRWFFGRRSTQQDVEMPGTITAVDLGASTAGVDSSLADNATITLVTGAPLTAGDDPGAPLGQLLSVRTEQLNPSKWGTTFTYGNTSSIQKVEFPENVFFDDPSDLKDAEKFGMVTADSARPTDPSPTIGALVLRSYSAQRVSGTPGRWLHRWEFGRRSTAEDITLPGTVTAADVSSLHDKATITEVGGQLAAIDAPAAPLGQLVGFETEQLYSADSGQWRNTFTYANTTAQQEVEFGGTENADDSKDLSDEAIDTIVNTSSTPPVAPTHSGLKLRRTRSQRIGGTPEQWKHTFSYARRDTQDDIEMPGTETLNEQTDLGDSGRITQVTASVTPPTAPAAPTAACKLLRVETRQQHASKWAHTFVYGPRSAQDEIEMPATHTGDDPQDLVDEAEITQVTTSATPPTTPAAPVGTKLYKTTTRPIKDGRWAHTFEFHRRDSKDAVQMDGTVTRNDATSLTDSATITQVTTSGTPPAAPASPDADAVLVETESQQLHPNAWRHKWTYAPRTSQQAVEMDGTFTSNDPLDLSDSAEITLVNSSSTPPAIPTAPTGQKHRRTRSQQLTGGKWKHSFEYGERTTQEEVEFEANAQSDDSNDLKDSAVIAQVTGSATPPATPASPLSGAVFIERRFKQLTDDKFLHSFFYGPRDSKQEVEFDGTVTRVDPMVLKDSAEITQVTASGTPPAVPTAPNGQKHRGTRSQQLTSGKWKHTFEYADTDSSDDIEFPGTENVVDPTVLDARASITLVVGAGGLADPPPASPIANVKLVRTITRQLTPSRWLQRFEYAPRSSKDEIEFGGTVKRDDPVDLGDTATITVDHTAGTGLATPAAPISGTKIRQIEIQQLTDARWRWLFTYGRRDAKDEVELDGTATADDAADVADSAEITQQTTSGTPPATPAAPVGTKLYETVTRQIHATAWAHTFRFRRNDRKDEIEFGGSSLADDPGDLKDEQLISLVTASGTPPAAPGGPSGTVLISTTTRQVNPAKWNHIFRYGARTSVSDVEMPGTVTSAEAGLLAAKATITQVQNLATPAAPFSPPTTGVKHVGTSTVQLKSGKWAHTYRYETQSPADEITMAGTVTDSDAIAIESKARITLLAATSTPPTAPAAPFSTTLRDTISQQINDNNWKHTFVYAATNTQQDIEFPATYSDDDATDLRDGGLITAVNASSTPPAIPTAPGTSKYIETRSQKLVDNPGDLRWKHTFRYGPRNPADDVTMDGTSTEPDPAGLGDTAKITLINASSTPPAVPAVPLADVKHRGTITRQLKDNKFAHTFQYATRDRKDEIELDGTVSRDDQANIGDTAEITRQTASGTPAAAPAAPVAGTKHVETITRQIHATAWAHTYRYATNDRADELTFENTRTVDDAQDLDDEATVAMVTALATPPAAPAAPITDTVLISVSIRQLNPGKWLHTFRFGRNTTKDRVERPGTIARKNPFDLVDERTTTVVDCLAADTASSLAATEFNSRQGTASFAGVEIEKLTPTKARRTVITANDDKTIKRYGFRGGWEQLRSDGASVLVSQVRTAGSGQTWCYIVSSARWKTRGFVRLRRRIVTDAASTLDQASALTKRTHEGSVNSTVFLGEKVGSLAFQGAEIVGHYFSGDSRVFIVDYLFLYDSLGHYDDSQVSLGWVLVGSAVATGYRSVSTFSWTLSPATLEDFAPIFMT
jgi:hypothetical protein